MNGNEVDNIFCEKIKFYVFKGLGIYYNGVGYIM